MVFPCKLSITIKHLSIGLYLNSWRADSDTPSACFDMAIAFQAWTYIGSFVGTCANLSQYTLYAAYNIWSIFGYHKHLARNHIYNTYSLSIWVITQLEMGLFENSVPKIRVDHCVLIEIVLNWRYTPFTDPHIPHIISRLASYVPQKSPEFVG